MKTALTEKLTFRPPPPGCVLSLPGLPGGGSKLFDRSPYGNPGTVNGATWQRLQSGICPLSFDGVDDYIDCGNNNAFNATGDFTIEAWLKVNNPAASVAQGIAWKKAANAFTAANGWGAYVQQGQLYINYGKVGGGYQDKGVPFTSTQWTHIAVGKCGGSVFWIYNGVPSPIQTVTGNPEVNSVSLLLGKIGGTNLLTGMMAYPRIHRRALSPLEARRHFDAEKELFGVW